jgi:hypothetical protein
MTPLEPFFARRSFALASLVLLLLALPVGRAAAEPTFAFDATPGKLPKTVVPLHYALDLKPDLDKLTFAASETAIAVGGKERRHLALDRHQRIAGMGPRKRMEQG